MTSRILQFSPRLETEELHVSGVGIREEMQPGVVMRPGGTGDRLLMFFYDPVEIETANGIRQYPANTLMLWEDRAGHHYGNSEHRWMHSWLHFHGSRTAEMLAESGLVSGLALTFSRPEVIEEYLFKLYKELTGQYAADGVMLRNLFHCMLLEMGRFVRGVSVPAVPERILRVKLFIEKNLSNRVSLAQLAKLAGLSVPRFCAEFKKWVEESPVEYHLRLRFELAKYLLGNRNLQIAEIAEQTGYGDIFQFSKMFRKRAGQSPSAFRNT